MGRILIFVGVLALCAGIVVPIAGSLSFFGNFTTQIEDAINPEAAEYCNPGETIETTSGPSTRSSSGTYSRVTFYFCQNAAGERREVTDAVNRDILGSPSGFLGNISSIFTGGLAAVGLSLGGIVLIIAGVFMTARSNARVTRFSPTVTSVNLRSGGNTPIGSSPFGNSPIGAPPIGTVNPTQTPSNAGGMQGDVIDFVRDQLDTAYRNGQISREDYDRAVDKLKRQ